MQKTSYLKELSISATQKKGGANNNKKDVMKIQSWLSLFSMSNPNSGTATGIDGDFGQATEKAVMNFQKAKNINQNGIVDKITFDILCEPVKNAFEGTVSGSGLRQLIINTASLHLKQRPFELVINGQANTGPWVRAYMDGKEGNDMFWCMGFVQAIVDQAASLQGKNFKTLMPPTFSCDTVGTTGLQKGLLHRFGAIRNNPALAKPGDIFLLQKSLHDWTHTGIIISVGNGIFETIEGNTNEGGSRNGNAVCKRVRSFMQSKLDVFSIEPLV
jgi:peptidoglycan hydrolase-like protein with peptidoglycan-binding domain